MLQSDWLTVKTQRTTLATHQTAAPGRPVDDRAMKKQMDGEGGVLTGKLDKMVNDDE